MSDAPEPVADAVLEDLRSRLAATRRTALPAGKGWDRGTDTEHLTELLAAWSAYDWRPHEDRIRALPWVQTSGTRAVHQRAADEDAPVVVLLHGWPDSVLRFERVLPLLTDVHVVVPALPGYPFSNAPGAGVDGMADVVAETVAELGHDRYVVSGGDIGSGVAERIAHRHPDRVAALHLTDVPFSHLFAGDELSEAERAYRDAGRKWQGAEGGYMHEQSTKPHTLAVGLNDSPAGLAAWIVEKLRSWTDDVEASFTREEVLTWITAYWVTGVIGTSFSPYFEPREPIGRVDVPTAVTLFPGDLVLAPREYAERWFDVPRVGRAARRRALRRLGAARRVRERRARRPRPGMMHGCASTSVTTSSRTCAPPAAPAAIRAATPSPPCARPATSRTSPRSAASGCRC